MDVLKANFGNLDQVSGFRAKVTDITNGVQVEANVDVKASLMSLVGVRHIGIEAPCRIGTLIGELFGISSAQAQEVTPTTRPPVAGTTVYAPSTHAPSGTSAFLPTGWRYNNSCSFYDPNKVNAKARNAMKACATTGKHF
jgi:hypothetical protein